MTESSMFDPPPELPNEATTIPSELQWGWLALVAILGVGVWWARRPRPVTTLAVSTPTVTSLAISPVLMRKIEQVGRRATPNAQLRSLIELARLQHEWNRFQWDQARHKTDVVEVQADDRLVKTLQQLHAVMWASYLQQAVCLAGYLAWRCRPSQCPTEHWTFTTFMCLLVQWAYVPLGLTFFVGALTRNYLTCIAASAIPLWYVWDAVARETELLGLSAVLLLLTVAVHAGAAAFIVMHGCKQVYVHMLFFVVLPATALLQAQLMHYTF